VNALNGDKSNTLTSQKTINIDGSLMDLSTPKVMGIINITPDSFFSGSRKEQLFDILKSAESMLEEGATFLDIGGYSTRPGAEEVSPADEIDRVLEPVESIAKHFPEAVISIDTFRADVAKAAVDSGAKIVNDISAGMLDTDMLPTVGQLGVPYIGMHMRGTPQNMKALTDYDDLLKEIAKYFAERIAKAEELDIKDYIIDPGFGFAKTVEQNFSLLNQVDYLHHLSRPMLIGISRKSMIYRSLNVEPDGALNGTTVLNTVALLKGASILRVHDVKEAVEAVKLINLLSH